MGRSACPRCHHILSWAELIPVVSWFALRGKCLHCKKTISWLYPFIEMFTAFILYCMVTKLPTQSWIAYTILFSALIVTIRSDLETMLISRFVTVLLIPVAFFLGVFDLLPITFWQSIAGALTGYFFLYMIGWIYYACTKRVGMGQGDVELLAMIGSFLGIQGWWASLMLASIAGSFSGMLLMFALSATKTDKIKLPFGPFLALGALCYVFASQFFLKFFLHI
jgi:leader peptidase (prepilin peptidase)/N-methyltransferase